MTQHDPAAILRHMLEYASRAVEFAAGHTADQIESDRMRAMALAHAIVDVGQAANRATSEQREAYPGIPRSQTVRLRNRVVHGYDTVDYEIVKEIVDRDLPPLIEAIEDALRLFDGDSAAD